MATLHKITVKAPTPSTQHCEILMDGKPMVGVERFEFVADGPTQLCTVTMRMAATVEIDANVEPTLETKRQEDGVKH